MGELLSLRSVSKGFVRGGQPLPVLVDVSLEVAAGEIVAVVGSKDSGKTTLLRALANEIPPYERLITVERALELGLGEFVDLHPNFETPIERLATWLARLDDDED